MIGSGSGSVQFSKEERHFLSHVYNRETSVLSTLQYIRILAVDEDCEMIATNYSSHYAKDLGYGGCSAVHTASFLSNTCKNLYMLLCTRMFSETSNESLRILIEVFLHEEFIRNSETKI